MHRTLHHDTDVVALVFKHVIGGFVHTGSDTGGHPGQDRFEVYRMTERVPIDR